MAKILVVYHCKTGNVRAMAEAVCEGAKAVAGADVSLKRVEETSVDEFVGADGLAFGTPEYFGYMAGVMKDLFDRAFMLRDKVAGRPFCAFALTGTDIMGGGVSALNSIEKLSQAFKLNRIAEGVVAKGKPSDEIISECREIGEALARSATGFVRETT